jgi:hypothetical protein
MLRVGFEPKIPVFERKKAVHALDSAVTVIDGELLILSIKRIKRYICKYRLHKINI